MDNIERGLERGNALLLLVKQLKAAGCDREDVQAAIAEMRDKERRQSSNENAPC